VRVRVKLLTLVSSERTEELLYREIQVFIYFFLWIPCPFM
jgi:hypothetical protein